MAVGEFGRKIFLRSDASLLGVLPVSSVQQTNKGVIMSKSLLKLSILGCLCIAVAGLPIGARGQATNAPATKMKEAKAKKPSTLPMNGKLKAVDKTARTISVGTRTFQVTAETRISKGELPATLDDSVVGEAVSGAYQKGENGKLTALSLHFGPKPAKPVKVTKEKTKME
jgi:hypothetical protein